MAGIKKPKRRVATQPHPKQLTLKEREELRAILSSPLVERALELTQESRPGAFIPSSGSQLGSSDNQVLPETALLNANNRLHEMRGWDLYQTALFGLVVEVAPKKEIPTESYPDAGKL